MKKIFMTAVLAAIVATGCKSKTEKVETTSDGTVVTETTITTPVDNTQTELEQIKIDMRREIAANDERIADFREKMKTKSGQAKVAMGQQIDTIEARNKRFRDNLNNWSAEGKESWQDFKARMEASRDKMKQDFEDFRKNN